MTVPPIKKTSLMLKNWQNNSFSPPFLFTKLFCAIKNHKTVRVYSTFVRFFYHFEKSNCMFNLNTKNHEKTISLPLPVGNCACGVQK